MRILKLSFLLCALVITIVASCSSNISVVTPNATNIAYPTIFPTTTFTLISKPTHTPTITPTDTPIPTVSMTRINLSSELYLDENSSLDNLGEPNYPEYSYFHSDKDFVWGYVYQFGNEEWVIAQTETCIFPSKDANCDSPVDGKLRAYYVQLWKDGEIMYSRNVNYGDQPHTFLRYDGHWIFSFGHDGNKRGWIIQDGTILNDLYDYDTSFSLFLLNDKPFFFFRRGDQFGISFHNEEILLPYPNVSFDAICCDGGGRGAKNPRASNTKVGFWVWWGDNEYKYDEYRYIEIGLR